jgi:hypothetical protein
VEWLKLVFNPQYHKKKRKEKKKERKEKKVPDYVRVCAWANARRVSCTNGRILVKCERL